MKKFIEIIRPLNCLMASIGVFISALVEIHPYGIAYRLVPISFGMLTAFLFIGAGNTLNDYVDRETDKINHPERPIPSGKMRPKTALIFSVLLFGIGTIAALSINSLSFGIAMINAAALIAYEIDLKRRGVIGNLNISYLVASIFLFGGAVVNSIEVSGILALLAFLATFGREVVKSVEDVEGDTNRRTLPKLVGKRNADIVASVLFASAVALSPLPYYLSIFRNWLYLTIVAVADVIFIYCIVILFKHPRQASKRAKLAMLVALIAFLVGGLL
jgi:geranylgeranylglycerol-phosphate geranylgeranyltransferase